MITADNSKIRELIVFDLDATMINTMLPDEGKKIWLEKTGTEWNHRGWWGRSESLDLEVFEQPRNEWVYDQYMKSVEIGAHRIILTGRIVNLEDKVKALLEHNGISEMNEIYCNGCLGKITKTERFKINVLGKFIREHGDTLERIVFYDDRKEHLPVFREWAIDTQKRTGIKVVVDQIIDGRGRYEL